MTIELDRESIAEAIKDYMENKVFGYGTKDKYDIKVIQGKMAKATVVLTKKPAVPLEVECEPAEVECEPDQI